MRIADEIRAKLAALESEYSVLESEYSALKAQSGYWVSDSMFSILRRMVALLGLAAKSLTQSRRQSQGEGEKP